MATARLERVVVGCLERLVWYVSVETGRTDLKKVIEDSVFKKAFKAN